jgi:hypothetical protein
MEQIGTAAFANGCIDDVMRAFEAPGEARAQAPVEGDLGLDGKQERAGH